MGRSHYALHIGADVWVIHAFQKKSKSGIATPRQEIDLVREHLKRLREINCGQRSPLREMARALG
jgi:phage-related protein